jgi:hypothetical protein
LLASFDYGWHVNLLKRDLEKKDLSDQKLRFKVIKKVAKITGTGKINMQFNSAP